MTATRSVPCAGGLQQLDFLPRVKLDRDRNPLDLYQLRGEKQRRAGAILPRPAHRATSNLEALPVSTAS